jgi:hypothetical protein
MRKLILLLGISLMAAPANADIIHKLSSSIQLTVDSPAVTTSRIGSTYSVSGNNITPSTAGNLGSLSAGDAVGYTPTAYGLTTAGSAYSFSETFIEGDATAASQTALSGGQFGAPKLHGSSTTFTGGTAGTLAGTITSAGAMALTAGGAGTNATGQFVSELTISR